MLKPTLDEFRRLAASATLVPVCREHLADMETPVSVLSRFADDDYVFLLESVEGGERWGRYSFIGIRPRALFEVRNGHGVEIDPASGDVLREFGGGLDSLRQLIGEVRPAPLPGLPRLFGGAIGTLAYETVNEFERLPPPKSAAAAATATFMMAEQMIIFDNVRHTATVVVAVRPHDFASADDAYAAAGARIAEIERLIRQPAAPVPPNPPGPATVTVASNLTREAFCAAVRRTKQYILDGDIIQAVLSQRFNAALPSHPLQVYRALRLINPSPYMFYMKFRDRILIGSSPEIMVRLTGRKMELRPIAGTRPRGDTEQEDRRLADELLADEKERAEHVMLVDLGRNDLGRVAVAGSVQVQDFMTVERYSHVMHIVSHVQGELLPGKDAFDVIRATFPAGTLSGAPKIRAMEIIHELEPQPRGAYGGAVGYIGFDGNMDLAITIRTAEIVGGQVSFQAGAGIVADSDPEREYQETVAKATAMVRALELAARGLDLEPGT